MLKQDDFIDEHCNITNRGYIACCMIECHGLVMADIILNSKIYHRLMRVTSQHY